MPHTPSSLCGAWSSGHQGRGGLVPTSPEGLQAFLASGPPILTPSHVLREADQLHSCLSERRPPWGMGPGGLGCRPRVGGHGMSGAGASAESDGEDGATSKASCGRTVLPQDRTLLGIPASMAGLEACCACSGWSENLT